MTVYGSVSMTRYIITCNTHFPSDVVVVVCETILDIINRIVGQILENIHFQHEDEELTVRTPQKAEIKNSSQNNDNDFYNCVDTIDDSCNGTTHLYNEKNAPVINNDDISTEINGIIRLIKRDFIESWYKLISTEPSGLVDADILFRHIVQGVQGRLYRANTKKVFEFILLMFKDHVHFVKQAQEIYKVQSKIRHKKSSAKPIIQGESIPPSSSRLKMVYMSVEECYGSKVELHPAVKSIEIEHAYQMSIIELLLVHLLREDMNNSPSLKCALKEILMFNVLQKVMDLICNTTFLHERVIEITSDADICAGRECIPIITVSETETSAGEVQSILTTRKLSKNKSDLNPQLELTEVIKSYTSSTKELDVNYENVEQDAKWKEDTELHTGSKAMCNECNRLCSTDKDRISPRPHVCSLGTTPTFFDINADPDRVSLNSFTSLSSNSSTESPVHVSVGKGSVETDAQQTDICHTEETSSTEIPFSLRSKEQSPSCTSEHDSTSSIPVAIPTTSKASESSSDTESKPLANIFPTLKFPFANPLNSLSNFKRSSFKSLSPTIESASDACLEQNKSDIKRSLSHGDVKLSSANNPWPTDGPSVFQGVRILTTEKAKEAGSFGEYTLYNVEVRQNVRLGCPNEKCLFGLV